MQASTIPTEKLLEFMETAGVPGLVFSIIKDRQVISTQAIGVKNKCTRKITQSVAINRQSIKK